MITGMTDDQLRELNIQLGAQQDDLRHRRLHINDELRRRAANRLLAAAGLSVKDALVRGQTIEIDAGVNNG